VRKGCLKFLIFVFLFVPSSVLAQEKDANYIGNFKITFEFGYDLAEINPEAITVLPREIIEESKPSFKKDFWINMAGHVNDSISTIACLKTGQFKEGNGFLALFEDNLAAMTAVKLGLAAGLNGLIIKTWGEKKPRLAKYLIRINTVIVNTVAGINWIHFSRRDSRRDR
jgi:hypothetical protein